MDEDDEFDEVICERCCQVWSNEQIVMDICPGCGQGFTAVTTTDGRPAWVGRICS
jgi:Zn finger protein HypA/HybF involved in hydrogenase expression